MQQLHDQHVDDYSEILPLFIYPDESKSKSMYPDMDRVIAKTSKVIDKHSIYLKKEEHIKWIDDSYLLMGKARFYKQEHYVAIQVFEYVAKAFKKKPSKNEALIWLARTHMELDEMDEAEGYLTVMENGGVPKQYSSEFNAVFAEFYIRKHNYEEAIVRLTKALETTKKKQDRRRFTYVLAQLWLKKKEYSQASGLFTKVIKLRPEYSMMFHAKINRALSYDVKDEDKGRIKKMLEKMVKDKKNVDFLDQIYFALADIAFKEEDEPLAIEYLKKSVSSSTSNAKQKALSYLRLGQYYYEKPEYVPAQAYYDSCLAVLPETHKDFDKIYERGRALTKLVDNIMIVQLEDSLQRMALDESYRKETINKLVQDAVDEEARKKAAEESDNFDINFAKNNSTNFNTGSNTAGKWYFYNQTTLGFGFSDFKKNWGNRKLEDNWRRKDKQTVVSFEDDEGFEDESDTTNTTGDSTVVAVNEKTDPKYYEQFIPLTDKAMNISHNKIIEALYATGNIYREDFEDYKNSIKSFEDLIVRYDTCRYVLPSWYNLYRISLLIDDDVMKEKYKSLILTNHPESEYAKIIQDPSYNKVTRENRKRVNNYYSRVYDLYTDRFYSKVLIRCEKAKSIFADNHLQDRFDFLAALSVGYTNTIDSFKIALNRVIKLHPESHVKEESQKILDLIKKGIKDVPKETETKVPYVHDINSKFMFVIVVPNTDKKINKYKVDIANFNTKYYSTTKFQPISNVFLNTETQVITVKEFKGHTAAMDYYKSFILNADNLNEINSKSYQSFIISNDNFILLYKDKNIKGYYNFFLANFDVDG
jgi:tetratricopeptide (TPR) repeat protein